MEKDLPGERAWIREAPGCRGLSNHRSFAAEPVVASIQAQRVVQAAPKARKARSRRLVSMA